MTSASDVNRPMAMRSQRIRWVTVSPKARVTSLIV